MTKIHCKCSEARRGLWKRSKKEAPDSSHGLRISLSEERFLTLGSEGWKQRQLQLVWKCKHYERGDIMCKGPVVSRLSCVPQSSLTYTFYPYSSFWSPPTSQCQDFLLHIGRELYSQFVSFWDTSWGLFFYICCSCCYSVYPSICSVFWNLSSFFSGRHLIPHPSSNPVSQKGGCYLLMWPHSSGYSDWSKVDIWPRLGQK